MGQGSEEDPPTPEKTRIEELMETAATDNETVLDKYGNKIRIPAGFKIVEHGTKENDNNMVEYIYDKEDGTLPTPAQAASKTAYDTPTSINSSYNSSYKHIEISSNFAGGTFGGKTYKAAGEYKGSDGKTNTKLSATNLQDIDNGGYYIARYEASKNVDKAASKVSTGTPAGDYGTVSNEMLWNNIIQLDAATASKAMYPNLEGAKYYSDLINSYAWDTAIIFIEKYSGDSDYANQGRINSKVANTGTNADKRCNIQDMAGNALEWTTETSTYPNAPWYGQGW